MTLLDALKDITPGEVISCGKRDEIDFVELFVLQDGTIRFSDPTMEIGPKVLASKEWVK